MPAVAVAATSSTLLVDPAVRSVYHRFRQNSPAWQDCVVRLQERFRDPGALLEDLFLAFYAPNPRLNPEADPSRHWQAAVMASLLIHPIYRSLHARTMRDPLLAALAALRLAECLDPEEEAPVMGSWRRFSPFGHWGRLGRWSGLARHGPRRWLLRLGPKSSWRGSAPVPPGLPLTDRHPTDRNPTDGQRTWRLTRVLERLTDILALDEKVRAAWASEAWDARGGWGTGVGCRSLYAFDNVWSLLDMARRIQNLEALTDTLARLQGLVSSSPKRKKPGSAGRHRLLGITQGNDLECLIPEEVAKFADPATESLFLEAYEHRRLLLHRYAGWSRQQAGPLIACVDVSRSMNTPAALGRERFVWAKALALTLLQVARQEGRDFLGVCFSSQQEVETFFLPAGAQDPQKALLFARCDFDGGTHFEAPLRRALQHLRQRGARHGHIVFITDGEAPVSPEILREYRQARPSLDYRLLPIFIDGFHPQLAALGDAAFQVTSGDAGSWEQVVLKVSRTLTSQDITASAGPHHGGTGGGAPGDRFLNGAPGDGSFGDRLLNGAPVPASPRLRYTLDAMR